MNIQNQTALSTNMRYLYKHDISIHPEITDFGMGNNTQNRVIYDL
jgi:hypothetical protein